MKRKSQDLNFTFFLIISIVSFSGCLAYCDIIHESATMGAAGQDIGRIINSEIYLGSRFYIEQDVKVTAVGGHLSEWALGTLFGAIIRLDSGSDLPDGSPFYASEVVATKAFSPGYPSNDYRTSLSVELSPGWYALVFGTDYFGALGGYGLMPTEGQTDLPAASPIAWFEGIWQNSSVEGLRFVVEGFAFTPTNSKITGSKFNDLDKDGILDEDEPTMEGWEIYLDSNDNGSLDNDEPSTVTNADGFYEFTNVTPGEYYIREIDKTGWQQTLPGGDGKYTVTIDPNQVISGMDFGNCISSATIVSLEVLEDSYTDSFNPTQNYGIFNSMLSGRFSSSVYRTFLKFDLSSIPPGQLITSARLHLSNNLVTTPAPQLGAYLISSDGWSETSITWNNMPDTQQSLYTDAQYPAGDATTFNVTSDADQEYATDGIYSLVIMSTDESSEERAGFWSKEFAVANMRPTLEIEYEPIFGGGSGEPGDPFLMYTAEHMNSIGLYPHRWNKHYKLMAEISLADYTGSSYNIIGTTEPNSPEGDGPFRGFFDGNNHTIKDLSYSASDETAHVGLFGYILEAAVWNLNIASPNIQDSNNNSMCVGAITGFADQSDIYKCSVEGGTVEGRQYVGGLVGVSNDSHIERCYSSAEVSGHDMVGGFAGSSVLESTLTNCYAKGTVSGMGNDIGGFIGQSHDSTAENCYSACIVEGAVESLDVGGFTGEDSYGNYTGCFWDSTLNPSLPGVGNDTIAGVIGETTANMYLLSNYIAQGWDFIDTWDICEGSNYPKLKWQEAVKGDFGCPDGVGIEDLLVLVNCWLAADLPGGQQPECTIVDFDADNQVTLPDFAVFSEIWLNGI